MVNRGLRCARDEPDTPPALTAALRQIATGLAGLRQLKCDQNGRSEEGRREHERMRGGNKNDDHHTQW